MVTIPPISTYKNSDLGHGLLLFYPRYLFFHWMGLGPWALGRPSPQAIADKVFVKVRPQFLDLHGMSGPVARCLGSIGKVNDDKPMTGPFWYWNVLKCVKHSLNICCNCNIWKGYCEKLHWIIKFGRLHCCTKQVTANIGQHGQAKHTHSLADSCWKVATHKISQARL